MPPSVGAEPRPDPLSPIHMKQQKTITRFYIWDYIWWLGEKLSMERRDTRIDGPLLLTLYFF